MTRFRWMQCQAELAAAAIQVVPFTIVAMTLKPFAPQTEALMTNKDR